MWSKGLTCSRGGGDTFQTYFHQQSFRFSPAVTNQLTGGVPNKRLKLTELAVDDHAARDYAKTEANYGVRPRNRLYGTGNSPPQLSRDSLGSFAPALKPTLYWGTIMKSNLLAMLILFSLVIPVSAEQQPDSSERAALPSFHRGTYLLSGSVAYTYTSNPDISNSITTFSMSPSYLYFISPKFALGGQFTYAFTKETYSFSSSTTSLLGFGPEARVYILQKPSLIFCSVSALIANTSYRFEDIASDEPSASYAAINLGTDIFFATHLAAEPFLEYQYLFRAEPKPASNIIVGISIAAIVY